MILVYSVAALSDVQVPPGLKSITRENLQCFYEPVEKPPAKETIHEEAVRFFRTNQQIYTHTDILEFRFPTLLKDEESLTEFMAKNEAQLAAELSRLSGKAQITVYFPETPRVQTAMTTGTGYLQASRDRIVGRQQLVREVLDSVGEDTIDSTERNDQLLLLVPRPRVANVIARISTVDKVRIAGPFPPSAFAKLLS